MTVDEENIKVAYLERGMTYQEAVAALIKECDMVTMEAEEIVHSWDNDDSNDNEFVAPFERDLMFGDPGGEDAAD